MYFRKNAVQPHFLPFFLCCCYNSDLILACVDSIRMSSLLTPLTAEQDTRHAVSATHVVVPHFNRSSGVKVRSDLSAVTDVKWSGVCAGTAQVGALQSRESLTKMLFEHWLNISQSYKKQRSGYSRWERGGLNQILYTAGTFFFFFFPPAIWWISFSPVPAPINFAGLVYKDISDPNANHDFNKDNEKPLWSKNLTRNVSDQFIFSFWGGKKPEDFLCLSLFGHSGNRRTRLISQVKWRELK